MSKLELINCFLRIFSNVKNETLKLNHISNTSNKLKCQFYTLDDFIKDVGSDYFKSVAIFTQEVVLIKQVQL